MHLQNQAGAQALGLQAAVYAHHGQLDDIRGGALDGGVHGHALAQAAHVEIAAGKLRQRAAAAVQRCYIAVFTALLHGLVQIFFDAREIGEIVFDERVGFLDADADILGQAERADAVHDAEVDRLGGRTQRGRDLFRRQTVDSGRSAAVDVCAGTERLAHGFVAGDVRKKAQFDLAVIRVQQRFALRRDEIFAEAAAQLGSHGDILQIGLTGGNTAGTGLRLVEGGMDAPVRPHDLEQALDIGGIQLLVGSVLQDVADDGGIVPQALQRFGVGGITAFRFFACGQAKILKQRLAQLLGAVDVELIAYFIIDGAKLCTEGRLQLLPKGFNTVPVHQNADVLHTGQHFAQREFDVVQQFSHALCIAFFTQHCAQLFQHAGFGPGRAERRAHAVFSSKAGHGVIAGRWVQQVGGQLCVESDVLGGKPVGKAGAVQRLCVETAFFGGFICKQRQKRFILKPRGIYGSVLYGQHHVSGGAKIDRARERGQGGRLHQRDSGRIVKAGLLRPGFGGQAQLVQRGVHFKVRQQACGGRGVRRVFFVCAGCGVYGRAAHDLGQRAAHPGLFFVPQQLFPHAFFDARVVDVFIHACQRAEILNEGKGCFFTHSRDAGNVVRRVAHQAFHLDELAGPDAVFFKYGGLVHHGGNAAAHLGAGQKHAGVGPHKLQAVPVSGCDGAFVAAGSAGGGQRAQNIVGLVALARHHFVAEVRQQLFQHGKLGGQLFGHSFALSLVAAVHFVAEGGRFQVKGDRYLVRFFLGFQLKQDIHEPHDGVGEAAVLCGEQLDAVKRAVDDAVAV